MTETVQIVDVAPRDGLQIECKTLPPKKRLALIDLLRGAGVNSIEIGSFVNPRRVPQMAGLPEICKALDLAGSVRYTALVPNPRGLGAAMDAGVAHVRMTVLASDSLNRANFERSVDESLAAFETMAALARERQTAFGAVIGAAFGCPLEGHVPPDRVMGIAHRMAGLGADEIVLADTTGMAMPHQVADLCARLIDELRTRHPQAMPGIHLHNTRNTGYANAYAAHQAGIRLFDTSLGGIGGCPFSPGALGNIATEDLVHMFNGMGVPTGIRLDKCIAASKWLATELGRELPAMIGRAEPIYLQPAGSS